MSDARATPPSNTGASDADRSDRDMGRALRQSGPNGQRLLARITDAAEFDSPLLSCDTRFGGIFILLPNLDDRQFAERTKGWPSCDGMAPGDILRLVVAAACFGESAYGVAVTDHALRCLLAIPENLSNDSLRDWTRQVGTRNWRALRQAMPDAWRSQAMADASVMDETADRGLYPPYRLVSGHHARRAIAGWAASLLRQMARRLPGFAAASAGHLQRNFLVLPAQLDRYGAVARITVQDPPLGVVLRLTGAIRGSLRPSWAPDMEIRWAPKGDDA